MFDCSTPGFGGISHHFNGVCGIFINYWLTEQIIEVRRDRTRERETNMRERGKMRLKTFIRLHDEEVQLP